MSARVSVGLAVVVCALALIGAGSSAAATVRGASGAKLVQFVRPTGDTLVQKGSGPIRVIVHLRAGARLTRVNVDGVVITHLLRRGAQGDYRGLLSLTRHLHYGYNDAFAQAVGRNGHRAHSHVRFIVAQRDNSLLRLTSFRTETTAAPLQVALRETTGTHVRAALSVADGVSARVYVNGRRVDRVFSQQRRRLMVALGGGEGLRFGRNLVQILVHKTHAFKRQSKYDLESRRVYIRRNAPIASAGANRTLPQHGLARFDGRRTKLPRGWTRPKFRWKIVSAPRGSKAKLRKASGIRPTLVPDRPGRYEVRVSVRAQRPGATRGIAAVALASGTGVSNDTATVTVMPDIPPAGVWLDTLEGSVRLGGQPIPGTAYCDPSQLDRCDTSDLINYAVLDRQTLQRTDGGAVNSDVAGMQQLGAIIDQYTGSLDHLVVLNAVAEAGGFDDARINAYDSLLRKIGAPNLNFSQRSALLSGQYYVSAVGVAGAPAGSAFVKAGQLAGRLRLNGVIGKYDFVFPDAVDFDTETNQTQADLSPAQLTIKVGESSYTQPNPGGGVSGFHLLVLNADSLYGGYQPDSVYTTNAADGAERPADVQQLASRLTAAADNPYRPLVILQAFGAPHGNDGNWDDVAKQIERLGGNRQVFNALNAVDPRPLNGEDANRKGPYAFVGRVDSSAPLAEASHSLNGEPGRLRGLLMRAHDGGYEPMIAGPPRSDGDSPVNTELIHIADTTHADFPKFTDANGQSIDQNSADAVQNFLGGPEVTRLCSAGVACDIRKLYYQSYRADWSGSILNALSDAQLNKCPGAHLGFTAAQCEGIRKQLRDEVSMVAQVTHYFGPLGLQQPFGANAGVAALANLKDIGEQITAAVEPPAADKTTSGVLDVLSEVLHIGGALAGGVEEKTAEVVAESLSGALGLTAYATEADGEPNLIGPRITTAASKLGVELADRYTQAGKNLDDLGRLIVSDWGKLKAVASKVDAAPGPGETDWRLGDVAAAQKGLERAAKRTIYERLVPLAYPVMYDVGPIGARDWQCQGGFLKANKHLFADQEDGAQFIGRFQGWTTVVAVAQEHATGTVYDARIPGIPAPIVDPLFNPIAKGGLGLSKLEFYSPRNGFRYLPENPEDPHIHKYGVGEILNTLTEFPYFSYGGAIYCSEIPDPPGNSG